MKGLYLRPTSQYGPFSVLLLSVDWTWEAYPIMHLDLNTDKYTTKEALEGRINDFLQVQEALYGYSVLNTLKRKTFGSYWFETGTPTYLATLLVLHDYNLEDMAQTKVDGDILSNV